VGLAQPGKGFFAVILRRNGILTKMKLAVLLTYYNEKTLLTECLSSLASQPEPPDEVLVYDDASVFPAQDFLLFPHPFSTLKIFRGEKNRGPAFGRNFFAGKDVCRVRAFPRQR
jgi:GT2 family glycosyltransferase